MPVFIPTKHGFWFVATCCKNEWIFC